jgi:myosin heavy subunit
MKNKKRIFLLLLMLLLYVSCQSVLFGKEVDIAKAKTDIKNLRVVANTVKIQEGISLQKKASIEDILKRLKNLEDDLSELDDKKTETEDGKGKFDEINKSLSAITAEINKLSGSNTTATSNSSTSNSNTLNPANTNTAPVKPIEADDWLSFLLYWGLIGLAGLLVIGGIAAVTYFLRQNKRRERDEIAVGFNQLRKQQKAFGDEIKQLTEVSKNLSQQIAQQKAEISKLKQQTQKAAYTASAPPPPSTMSAYQQPVEVSRFPVSVDDYLAKVKNGAIPVKYDYREKMLVEDRENEGNLLVVTDDSERDNSLFLVPSFGFFQTKSDYTSYFENYYACARPMGGSVWIRQPATVRRVSGGWQLTQQGELEVR